MPYHGEIPSEFEVNEAKAVVKFINGIQEQGLHHGLDRLVWEWLRKERTKRGEVLNRANELADYLTYLRVG